MEVEITIEVLQATKGFIPELIWYASRIGERFEVVGENADQDAWVVKKDPTHSVGWVYKEDCKVINRVAS